MKYKAEINVMPLKALLDPQGKTVGQGLNKIGLPEINNVRIGKHITLEIEADSADQANNKIEEACKKLLSNPIMESFTYRLSEQ